MKFAKSIAIGLGFLAASSLGLNAVAADASSRGTLKDGGGYEKQLEQSGMSGMSGMSGNHTMTTMEKVKAKQEKRNKKAKKVKKADAPMKKES